MFSRSTIAAVLVAIHALGAPAVFAQSAPAPRAPLKWEVGGGVGWLQVRTGEITSPCFCAPQIWNDEGAAEFRVDVARAIAKGFKAGVSVGAATPFHDRETDPVVVDGVTRFAGMERTARATTVSPSISYEIARGARTKVFFSAGARTAIVQEHRVRMSGTYVVHTGSRTDEFVIPPFEESRTVVLTRPFTAVGFKAYVSRRTFVRTEAVMAFGRAGLTQAVAHVGVGVDF